MQSLRFSLQPLSAATAAPGISTDRLRKACLNQQFSVIIPLLSCLTPCEGVTQASLCLLDGFGQIFSHTLWSGDMTASCWTENKGHNSTQGSRKFTGKDLKPWTHHFKTQSGSLNCLKGGENSTVHVREKVALFRHFNVPIISGRDNKERMDTIWDMGCVWHPAGVWECCDETGTFECTCNLDPKPTLYWVQYAGDTDAWELTLLKLFKDSRDSSKVNSNKCGGGLRSDTCLEKGWGRQRVATSQSNSVIATPPVCSCDSLRSEVMKTAMAPWTTDSRVESLT